MSQKPPLSVTLLAWLVLSFTAWHATRFVTSLAWDQTLQTYAPRPGPRYIGATGAIWALAGLFLLWSLRRRTPWTRIALLTAAGLYAAWVWIDRLWVQSEPHANWPFALAVTTLLLGFVAAVALHPKNRNYFERESYERESQNRPPS